MEESTTIVDSSNFFTAELELSSNSANCATLPDPPSSPSEYFSTRIQSMIDRRSEFGTNLEAEIESSKDHWSDLQSGLQTDSDEEVVFDAEKNLELFQSLQLQWPHGFFKFWKDGVFALGEMIAEGGQGEIFELRFLKPEHAHLNDVYVLKVFKREYCALQHLQKQWPQGMLDKANAIKKNFYMSGGCTVPGAMLLKDGRFAFYMTKYWGDLKKLIDFKIGQRPEPGAPFVHDTALVIMFTIARAMRALHRDNILHRDIKASNVLIASVNEDAPLWDFDPTGDGVLTFTPILADYECSVGVVGTGFWRAPEILLGLRNRDGPSIDESLFTVKSDVYSYAMTCYEVLTGKMPFEDRSPSDYDHVLQGARPKLPPDTKPWIKCLLTRCWEHDPANRPSSEEIVEGIEAGRLWGELVV